MDSGLSRVSAIGQEEKCPPTNIMLTVESKDDEHMIVSLIADGPVPPVLECGRMQFPTSEAGPFEGRGVGDSVLGQISDDGYTLCVDASTIMEGK